MMVSKIVVDTNVFINVLIGKGESAIQELFRKCLNQKYRPLMSNALFNEYNDVLNRECILEICPLTAEEKGMSINKLMEELSTIALVEFDVETRFQAMVDRGNIDRGMAALDKLDDYFAQDSK